MLLLYTITPSLGLIRNYIKYKRVTFSLYLRTYLVYFLINLLSKLLGYIPNIYEVLIYERWFFFVCKSLISLYRNDYYKKREKYKIKYGLKYELNKNKKLSFSDNDRLVKIYDVIKENDKDSL